MEGPPLVAGPRVERVLDILHTTVFRRYVVFNGKAEKCRELLRKSHRELIVIICDKLEASVRFNSDYVLAVPAALVSTRYPLPFQPDGAVCRQRRRDLPAPEEETNRHGDKSPIPVDNDISAGPAD